MQKFTKELPRDDLKKFAKEVAKKLVASDFKNGRVDDPNKISQKQEKKVKAYVRQFFEKAVEKRKELDKRKKEREKRAHRRPQAVAPQPSLAQQMLGGAGDGAAHPAPGAPVAVPAAPAHPAPAQPVAAAPAVEAPATPTAATEE